MLCDLGFKRYGICSDITTTFPVSGKFTEKQKKIYNLVLDIQRDAISKLKDGAYYRQIQAECYKGIVAGLKDLGLLKGDVEEMHKAGIGLDFMPHSIGHYIGFKVHDVGLQVRIPDDPQGKLNPEKYKQYQSVTREVLMEGMVITVEPGIYFIETLIEQAKKNEAKSKYFNFDKIKEYMEVGGVRIEDNLLITATGSENLSDVS